MEIARYIWNSEEALELIRRGQPVVLLECPICYPAMENWTFEKIAVLLRSNFQCDVRSSYTHRFTYFDESKNQNGYNFVPPTTKMSMSFDEFNNYIRSSNVTSSSKTFPNLYLQQGLVAEMGPRILEAYKHFSLETAAYIQKVGDWDSLTNNLLLCGKSGFISQLHFDEQENLFAQLHGQKRVRLFHPENWFALYPYPFGHPCDRQSQITLPSTPGVRDLKDPMDIRRFPSFNSHDPIPIELEERYVDLEAGEILYIPQYWFHQMEGLSDNISLSWWFKHKNSTNTDVSTLCKHEISLVAVRRNLEKLLSDFAGSGRKAHNFFLSVASGLTPITYEFNGVTTIAIPKSTTTTTTTSNHHSISLEKTTTQLKRSTDCIENTTSSTHPITLESFLNFPMMPLLETDVMIGKNYLEKLENASEVNFPLWIEIAKKSNIICIFNR
mmetsp:Transcript_19949/g.28574  ORF Transcript_19949/g.28574 Transcript_19949/m.28574 type:complete len:441 (+) Transcript_19949:104-1426(+)